jgi:hypothetical protein
MLCMVIAISNECQIFNQNLAFELWYLALN